MNLDSSLILIKGVGEKSYALYNKLHIYTVNDLLHYYPRDYEQYQEATFIVDCTEQMIFAIEAIVVGNPSVKKIRNLTVMNILVKDKTGQMNLTFFNMPYLKNVLKPGSIHIFRGLVSRRGDRLYMEQPRIYQKEEFFKLINVMQPVYPLCAGLTNNSIIKSMSQLKEMIINLKENLPEEIIRKYSLISYGEAVLGIHFPSNFQHLIEARKRLVFNEFFYFILSIRRLKESTEMLDNHYPMLEVADTKRLQECIPYELTNAQKKVWSEIQNDLQGPYAMNRLIQGDVGSGKTILAFLALLMAVSNGYQGALMAPTEVLAKQHFDNLISMVEDYSLPFKPILLTGSTSAKDKRQTYEMIENGLVNVIIGTHAIFQEKVIYKNLALVITDEQHRFGVRQRETLAKKGENVHVLVMSATPIPRTLAIILYGDLHLSVIDEVPSNRLPIKNCVVNINYRQKAYTFMEKEIENGRQIYIICPMVEQGEAEGLEDVQTYCDKLKSILSPNIQIAYLHGKMKNSEKNRIMEEFSEAHIDILISTTVIEVGINVPNASVMMVENAERFGLASLHQLRGRVGRGKEQSYCIFVNSSNSPHSKKRLDTLVNSNDGFHIANEDLKLRGPGDLFGIRQSGAMDFKLGDIYNDASILQETSSCIDLLLEEDPNLLLEKNSPIAKTLELGNCIQVDFRSI